MLFMDWKHCTVYELESNYFLCIVGFENDGGKCLFLRFAAVAILAHISALIVSPPSFSDQPLLCDHVHPWLVRAVVP